MKEENQSAVCVEEPSSAKKPKLDKNFFPEAYNHIGELAEEKVDHSGNTYLQRIPEDTMKNDKNYRTYWGGYLKFYGDVMEKKFYNCLKLKLTNDGDEFGLFHSIELLDIKDLQKSNWSDQLREKDIVVVNSIDRKSQCGLLAKTKDI